MAQINKISYYLPSNNVAGFEPDNNVDEATKYALKRSVVSIDEVGSDLAFKAANILFNEYPNREKESIDFLLYSTQGLDYFSPTTSSVLHHRLGLSENCGILDLPFGCAGFVYGLSVANALIHAGNATTVLFLLGEIPSKAIHEDDVDFKLLFSDAGVACLIESDEDQRIKKFVFGTDGNGFKNLNILRGGTRAPLDSDWIKTNPTLPHGRLAMNGLEILRFSLDKVPKLVNDILMKNAMQFAEIDYFVFHHSSEVILTSLQRKCAIPKEKFINYFTEVGNSASCSIPIALEKANEEGKFIPGNKIMLLGFGTGYAWAGTIIIWS